MRSANPAAPTTTRRPAKKVFICSPLAGEMERNIKKAEIYCRFTFEQGYVPVAPHIYFPMFLDYTVKTEREAGKRYGLETMWQCSQLWVFGDLITDGMRAEIEIAKELKIPVRYFDCGINEVTQ